MINIDDKTRRLSQATIVVGYKQENKAESIEFKIPDYLKEYGKKICFKTKDGKVFSKLFDNTTSNIFTFTRTETQYGELDATIQFFKTENEDMIVYKTSILHIIFNETINCKDEVQPDEPIIPILESLIEKVTYLNNTITENEGTRNNNENTRISNENSRIANETQRDIYYTGIQNKVNNGEFNGATFTPSVDKDGNISWTNNKGLENPSSQNIRGPQGIQGPQGEAFKIKKTYPSVETMQADLNNMQIGDYVMIVSSVELEDNAKLYTKTETEWVFITDFSGATGIQGEQGPQGIQGIQGERGIGISKLEVIDGSLWVTLTDSTTQNAGLIITDEVKQWLVNEITNNAESSFNQYYNTKVSEFNENVQAKLDEYNANAEALANKVVELETENTSLKNQIPSGEATGNPIHLTDSSDMECEIVPIGGVKEKLYLPEEYTQLEYIESSGTQYIDTNYKVTNNTKIYFKGFMKSAGGYVFGSGVNGQYVDIGLGTANYLYYRARIRDTSSSNKTIDTTIEIGETIREIILSQNDGFIIDGNTVGTFSEFSFKSDKNLYLFCWNGSTKADLFSNIRLQEFKIYENNILMRSFTPCYRKSDNAIGLYDTVNNVFYENLGTGNFVAGPEQTKSPDYPSEIVTVGQNGSVGISVDNGLETTDTNYQSYTKVLPTQKEFVKIGDVEDTFVKVEGKWYEKHDIPKYIFTGNESFSRGSTRNGFYYFETTISDLAGKYAETNRILCNVAKEISSSDMYEVTSQKDLIGTNSNKIRLMLNNINTVAELQECFAEQYANGTPATLYYLSTTTELIECTAEQESILNSFHTYKNITNISVDGIGTLKVNYKKDLETMFNNIIKQIPSSTSDTTET